MSEYTPITGLDSEPRPRGLLRTEIPRKTCLFTIVLLMILVMVFTITFAILSTDGDDDNGSIDYNPFLDPISLGLDITAFQLIAEQNGGSRDSATNGYQLSVNWVSSQFAGTKWSVKTHTFEFDRWFLTGSVLEDQTFEYPYTFGIDYDIVVNSGSLSDVSGLKIVKALNDGCQDSDYESIIPQDCTIDMKRGGGPGYGVLTNELGCTPSQKLTAAASQGFNVLFIGKNANHTTLALDALPAPTEAVVISLSYTAASFMSTGICGNSFGNNASRIDLGVSAGLSKLSTQNLIVDYPEDLVQNPGEIVVFGAHLDSPLNSPGINNNGAGASVLLELGRSFDTFDFTLENRPRLIFWSSSYYGNVGSRAYVESLSKTERAAIVAYINIEEIASTNYMYQIYDPNMYPVALQGPASRLGQYLSLALQAERQDYGLATEWQRTWTNDEQAFNEAGIASSGYFSGTEEKKTTAHQIQFGGAANAPADPCFSLLCDQDYNYSPQALNTIGNSLVRVLGNLVEKVNLRSYLYS